MNHTIACLSRVVIDVIENKRDELNDWAVNFDRYSYDSEGKRVAEIDFRDFVKSGNIYDQALDYLETGISICRCK